MDRTATIGGERECCEGVRVAEGGGVPVIERLPCEVIDPEQAREKGIALVDRERFDRVQGDPGIAGEAIGGADHLMRRADEPQLPRSNEVFEERGLVAVVGVEA